MDTHSYINIFFIVSLVYTSMEHAQFHLSDLIDSPVIIMFLYDPLSPNCIERTKFNGLCWDIIIVWLILVMYVWNDVGCPAWVACHIILI